MPNALMPDTSSYEDPTGNALLAKGYDASQAYAPAQAMQGLQMNQQVMQLRAAQLGQEQIALAGKKLSALNGVLGGLVANPTADNAQEQIGWATKMGLIDPQAAGQATTEIAGLGGDAGKIKQWALDHLNQNAQHQQLMDQAYGTPSTISNGVVTSPAMVRGGAQGGIYPAAGPNVVQQMGPGEAGSPVTGPPNPDGSPTVITKGQFAQGQGQGTRPVVTPFGAVAYPARGASAGQPAGAAASPAPVSFGGASGGGASGAQPAPSPAPATPQGGTPPAPAGGPMTVGLAPGVAEGKSAMAGINAKAYGDLQTAAATVPQQNAAIDNLASQLNKVSTGPIASQINTAKATYNQIAQMTGLPAYDQDGVTAYAEIHKSAAQLAGAAMAAMGGGTNDKLALAIAQNPDTTLSTMSNQQIVPLLKGLNAAVTVKNEAAHQYIAAHGNDPSTYGDFEADWNRNFSPRAFQFAFMSPAQRSDLIASMSPQEQAQLAGALNTAESRGWINPQGQR